MKEIDVSKFRVSPSTTFNKVQKTGKPVLVTRHGKPIVVIHPPSVTVRPKK